jgi:solute:Na+ symporter, SSS family
MPLHLFAMYLLVLWWAQRNSDGGGYFVQRMAACKDDRHAAKATLWFTFCHYVLRTWPWVIAALAAIVLYPPALHEGMDREAAYPMLMRDVLPVGLLGIAVVSLVAAFMSTIDTHVNWGASYLVTDVYKRFVRPQASEKHHVRASRVTVVLLAVIAALISTQMASIDAAWKLFMALGAGLGLPHLARWLWWRANAWTELSALVSTTLIVVIIFGLFPETSETARVLIIVALSTAVWLPVTLLTPPTDPETLDAFYREVRPLGFWGPVRARCAGVESAERGPSVLLAWAVGIAFVYLLLFGIGEVLIGRRWLGIVLVILGAVAGWGTYRLMISGERPAGDAGARPEATNAERRAASG